MCILKHEMMENDKRQKDQLRHAEKMPFTKGEANLNMTRLKAEMHTIKAKTEHEEVGFRGSPSEPHPG